MAKGCKRQRTPHPFFIIFSFAAIRSTHRNSSSEASPALTDDQQLSVPGRVSVGVADDIDAAGDRLAVLVLPIPIHIPGETRFNIAGPKFLHELTGRIVNFHRAESRGRQTHPNENRGIVLTGPIDVFGHEELIRRRHARRRRQRGRFRDGRRGGDRRGPRRRCGEGQRLGRGPCGCIGRRGGPCRRGGR